MYSFASDNYAPALPQVIDALAEANHGHAGSYGTDRYTERLDALVRENFGPTATAFPVFNGTGCNVVSLQSMQPIWGSVICASSAHINTDEGAAPERVAGLKLVPAETCNGKITSTDVDRLAQNFGNVHHAQPSVVSITESTELGTLYSIEEIGQIVEASHARGLLVHMDGARLTNAAAALGSSFKELTSDIGIDMLSFGGTKAGLLFGELVVALRPELAESVSYVRKFNMQLASKMRYISAQFVALLEDERWRPAAENANAMARLLREEVEDIPGLTITQETQVNSVFATLNPCATAALRESAVFQTWDPTTNEIRWMCSHDTTRDEVFGFAQKVRTTLDR